MLDIRIVFLRGASHRNGRINLSLQQLSTQPIGTGRRRGPALAFPHKCPCVLSLQPWGSTWRLLLLECDGHAADPLAS